MKSWRGRNTAREIRNHVNWQTPFSCLWTFAETGANSATSSNLKWTARSQRCPTGASLASSRWPHVLSTFIALHLLLNLHEYVAGGVLLLAAAPVADGALPCHWSWRPGQHPQVPVPSQNFPLAYKMFAHKLPSGTWSLVSPCPSWPLPSSASPWCCSSPSTQPPKTKNAAGVVHRWQQGLPARRLRRRLQCKTFRRCCVNSACGKE